MKFSVWPELSSDFFGSPGGLAGPLQAGQGLLGGVGEGVEGASRGEPGAVREGQGGGGPLRPRRLPHRSQEGQE
eukprot:873303-Prorocentrum_minimum.AAC.1